jgi:NAD(P)-dependent dehydrogenase (short-subunit alcohol dehydrogenase family)
MDEPRDPHGLDLKGRRVLVTGGASGIGFAACRLLIERGADVALLDLEQPRLFDAAKGLGAIPIAADLADPHQPGPAARKAAETMGGLDGVVNCAGVANLKPLGDLEPDEWMRIFAINLTAPYLILRAALPWLTRAPGASVVNVASGVGITPGVGSKGGCAYAASKAGLLGITRSLASELAPAVRVNAVCPGVTETPLLKGLASGGPALAGYALGRMATPAEIASVIVFLISGEASFVTGATWAADGGRTFH